MMRHGEYEYPAVCCPCACPLVFAVSILRLVISCFSLALVFLLILVSRILLCFDCRPRVARRPSLFTIPVVDVFPPAVLEGKEIQTDPPSSFLYADASVV